MNISLPILFALTFTLAISLTAQAETISVNDLIGDYRTVPRKRVPDFPEDWQESAEEETCLRVKRNSDGSLYLYIQSLAPSAAMCSVNGTAKLAGDVLQFEHVDEDPDESCKLTIKIEKDHLVLHDGNPACKRWFCAKDNQFEGTKFFRSSKTEKRTECNESF